MTPMHIRHLNLQVPVFSEMPQAGDFLSQIFLSSQDNKLTVLSVSRAEW